MINQNLATLTHPSLQATARIGRRVEDASKGLIVLLLLVVFSFSSISGQSSVIGEGYFAGITKNELELLIADLARTNPTIAQRLAKDPEMRRDQVENLKQLFAFASQAQREDLTSRAANRQELDSIRNEIVAVSYDKEINRNRKSAPAFGLITDKQIATFWNSNPGSEIEFTAFLKAKLDILRADNAEADRELTAQEKSQSRDIFAKTNIYKAEYDSKVKAGVLPKEFIDRTNLQVKLQQAQFLARQMMTVMLDDIAATDADVEKYISEHPQLDPNGKRAKAQGILDRAKAGENFSILANEFSEDPGNIDKNGRKQGGIYRDVPEGRMVAPFEKAALSLDVGQVAPNIVETDFGFHIIKLEKKGFSKDRGATGKRIYDVRHILISTSIEDEENEGRSKPLVEYVRDKIESEREKQYIDRIVAENNIQVPDDFEVPEVIATLGPNAVKKQPVSKKRPVKKRK